MLDSARRRTSKCLLWSALAAPLLLAIGCTLGRMRETAELARASEPLQRPVHEADARLLIVGDSTAVGTGASAPQTSLAGLLANAYPSLHIENRGRDGATFAELRSARLAGASGAVPSELTAAGLKLSTSGLLPLPEGRVLVIETDPEGQRKTAQAVSPKQKGPSPRIGPATDIVLTTAAGAPAVVAYSAPKEQGELRVQTLSAATLRPLSDRRYRALPGGAVSVGGSSASLLHVGEGYQTLELKQAGDYDKKSEQCAKLRSPWLQATSD